MFNGYPYDDSNDWESVSQRMPGASGSGYDLKEIFARLIPQQSSAPEQMPSLPEGVHPTVEPPSQFGQADALRQKQLGMGAPKQHGMTLLAGLGALLAALADPKGNSGVGFLQGFQGAQGQANQREMQNWQLQQQQLGGQADLLERQGQRQLGVDQFNTKLGVDQRQFEQKDATDRYVADIGLQKTKTTANAGITRAEIAAKARAAADAMSRGGRDAATAAQMILRGSPADKTRGYQIMRAVVPALQGLEDDEIEAAALLLNPQQQQQTAAADLSGIRGGDITATQPSRIAQNEASAGLSNARAQTEEQMRAGRVAGLGLGNEGKRLDNQYKRSSMQSRIDLAAKNVQAATARIALTGAQREKLQKDISVFDQEFQSRMAERQARIAKLESEGAAKAGNVDGLRKDLTAANSGITAQIKAIQSKYKAGAPPAYDPKDPESDASNDHERLKILGNQLATNTKKLQKLSEPKPPALGSADPFAEGRNIEIGSVAPAGKAEMTGSPRSLPPRSSSQGKPPINEARAAARKAIAGGKDAAWVKNKFRQMYGADL